MTTLKILGVHVHTDELNGLSNVVAEVMWSITGEVVGKTNPDGSVYIISRIGKSVLSSPNNSEFTTYDSLTEQQVEGWVESSQEYADGLAALQKSIAEESAPPLMSKKLPWVVIPENVPEAIEIIPEEIPPMPSDLQE